MSVATARDFRRIALSLDGATEAPHFDRAAFKVKRIYATLAADGKTANLKLDPDEQEFKCMLAPEVFAPVPNAWGKTGLDHRHPGQGFSRRAARGPGDGVDPRRPQQTGR